MPGLRKCCSVVLYLYFHTHTKKQNKTKSKLGTIFTNICSSIISKIQLSVTSLIDHSNVLTIMSIESVVIVHPDITIMIGRAYNSKLLTYLLTVVIFLFLSCFASGFSLL